jgi:predicted amidohydrolase YtcJ
MAVSAAYSSRAKVAASLCSSGIGAFCLYASSGNGAISGPADAVEAAEPADLVLTNGVIYTGDAARPRVEAVAIKGERIVAIGTSKEMQAWVYPELADGQRRAGSSTRVIDLQGRFAMPGFNDAHIHLASGGQAKLAVEFGGSKSLSELQQRIRARLGEYKPGEWITGRGWDHTLWPRAAGLSAGLLAGFPRREDLDAVSTQHPMIFTRVDGHVAIANSLALQKAGITKDTPNPAGGEIERDPKSGEPTGMLKENAMGLVRRHVPALTPEQRRRGIEMALVEAAEHGLTSIQDNSDWQDFLIYEQLKKEGKLTLRVTEWLPFTAPLSQLEEMRRRGGTTDPWLKTGALKGVTDGTLGSRTAAMLAPYADDASTTGILRIEPDRLTQLAIERDKAGFQIGLHAIGDHANRVSLDAFAAARAANGKRDARHKIEHAQVVAPEDFKRFADLNVIASMQPCHETTDMRWAETRVGPERSRGAYAWKSMMKHGVPLAFGTDYAVEPLDPMIGLYACVTRELAGGGPTGGWVPQEKISIDECIRGYTWGSAYAEFEEKNKGQIAVGKLADIVVLSSDVTKIPPSAILKTRAEMTIVGGRIVYEKK